MVRPRIIGGSESKKMTFSVSETVYARLRDYAEREKRSLSSVVREALENYLNGMEE